MQKLLGNRYQLIEKIGRGGMAEVYLAHDLLLDRKVAVKIPFENLSADAAFASRFGREARSAAALQHPNIVTVFDWGDQEGLRFLVMEYIDGETLKEVIARRSPMRFEEILRIAISVCDALNEAHSRGIVHRDVKPQNIIISRDGTPKVADFGIAKSLEATATLGSGIIGTAHYISPEQAKGEPVTPAADIYSLGVVIYEMITADPPFRGDSPISIAVKHINDDPVPPSAIRPDTPPALEAVVLKALAKDPSKRYQSALEMKQDLMGCLEGSKTPSAATRAKLYRPGVEGTKSQAKKEGKRLAPYVALGLVAALIAVGLVFTGTALYRRQTEPPLVVVPNISGMEVSTAEAELRKSGLNLSVVEQRYNDKVGAGLIIEQTPLPGEKAAQNSTVEVVISKGPETVTMPHLVGLTLDQAKQELEKSGLKIGKITSQFSNEAAKGTIIAQSIKEGEVVPKSLAVDVTVSIGPAMTTVPDLTGLSYSEAESAVRTSSLVPVRYDKKSDDAPPETVIGQDPPGGESVPKDSEVRIVVAVTTDTSMVPDLVGHSSQKAIQKLKAAGFDASLVKILSGPEEKDIVLKQEPAPGISRALGSVIRVYVGDGSL